MYNLDIYEFSLQSCFAISFDLVEYFAFYILTLPKVVPDMLIKSYKTFPNLLFWIFNLANTLN
jgi:hypothetical protein